MYADGANQGAPLAAQITDRYHLVSNLGEALERDVQQLQLDARATCLDAKRGAGEQPRKMTLIEAHRQRCRQQRYERYQLVVELGRQGHSQLAIGEMLRISPGLVAAWLRAPGFPERQIRSDRQRDQARFKQRLEKLQAPANRTHYSSGRVAGLLLKPEALSKEQKRYVDAFLQFCPKARKLRKLGLQFRAMLRCGKLGSWTRG